MKKIDQLKMERRFNSETRKTLQEKQAEDIFRQLKKNPDGSRSLDSIKEIPEPLGLDDLMIPMNTRLPLVKTRV